MNPLTNMPFVVELEPNATANKSPPALAKTFACAIVQVPPVFK